MKRKNLFRIVTAVVLSCSLGITSFAARIPPDVEIQDATVVTYWEYEKEKLGVTREAQWTEGPGPPGPGTITLEASVSREQGFEGSLGGTIRAINLELGLHIGEERSHTVSYSLPVDRGEYWTILYRMKFQEYEVTQRQIRLVIATGQETVLQTRYLTTEEFLTWEFAYMDSEGNIVYLD